MCNYFIFFSLIAILFVYLYRLVVGVLIQAKFDPERKFTADIGRSIVFVSDWNSPNITPEFRDAWGVCTNIDRIFFVVFPVLLFLIFFRGSICG
jgi:hypothetical protein